MKFSTLLALVASASAASTMDVQTMALRDQMKSLQTMVKIASSHKAPAMISAITDRKAELEYQLAINDQADKQAVARELQYLLSLVQSIESNDHESATKVLNNRKNKLIKYQMTLADAASADTDADGDDKGTTDANDGKGDDKGTNTDGKGDDKGTDGKGDDKGTDGKGDENKTDDEDKVDEEKSSGGMVGGIIAGVVVAGLLVGGCVYYKKKNSDDAEGGEKEDKKLFKLQFKGNTLKKIQKEALVPTFAIPAEENIWDHMHLKFN